MDEAIHAIVDQFGDASPLGKVYLTQHWQNPCVWLKIKLWKSRSRFCHFISFIL
jgi:hypothetical protein